jgi:hypothetical protein
MLSASASPCGPDQIYVREHDVAGYSKSDGSLVKDHIRSGHCRNIPANSFKDSTLQKFSNLSPKFKKWVPSEKKIVEENLEILPLWLKKYSLFEILRGDVGGHKLNPASSVPQTKTILIHELAHIAFSSVDPDQLIEFASTSGWKPGPEALEPPKSLLLPDSFNSIEEDFTNHVEIYHTNPTRLMTFNSLSFLMIKRIIEAKEKEE